MSSLESSVMLPQKRIRPHLRKNSKGDPKSGRRRRKRHFSRFLLMGLVFLFIELYFYGKTVSQLATHEFNAHWLKLPKTDKKFILFRAIGNDLPPRHVFGQSYNNLRFILENEPHFPDLEVRWLVNRIVDRDMEANIISLLKEYNQRFIVDPVDLAEFAKIPLNLARSSEPDIFHSKKTYRMNNNIRHMIDGANHDRNLYIMHNNQARNSMLIAGKASGAKYILPWDGNCFLNENAWRSIVSGIERVENMSTFRRATQVSDKYFSVPMARLTNNNNLLDPNYAPTAKEEPQLIFRRDAREFFNPKNRYGDMPKVELLMRLRMPGSWYNWQPKIPQASIDIPFPGSVQSVGWVARLFSGKANLETAGSVMKRAGSRTTGIWNILEKTDALVATSLHHYSKEMLLFYDEDVLARHKLAYESGANLKITVLIKRLIGQADAELMRNGTYSIVQNMERSLLEDKHDFFSFSSDESNLSRKSGGCWDRQSPNMHCKAFANFARNTTILALAGYITGDKRYNSRAVDLINHWFLNNDTRMNPNLRHGGIVPGPGAFVGTKDGLLDIVDLCYVLDAVRLLDQAESFKRSERKGLDDWFRNFATFMVESPQGIEGFYASTYVGTYFDLLYASMLSFLGQTERMVGLLQRSAGRLFRQFGSPEEEQALFTDIHVLNSWGRLVLLSRKLGIKLDTVAKNEDEAPFLKSVALNRLSRLIADAVVKNPQQTSSSTSDTTAALFWLYQAIYGEEFGVTQIPSSLSSHLEQATSFLEVAPLAHPGANIPPFWNLGLM